MTRKLWITRTLPASRSSEAWSRAGFSTIVAPLLRVEPVHPSHPLPNGSPLILTSAQAIRHGNLQGDARPIYAVGDTTAAAARAAGFTDVQSADGDWRALADLIPDSHQRLHHVCGEEVRGNLAGTLAERGISVIRHIVYKTVPVTEWPVDPAVVDAIALYSPKAARALMALPTRNLAHITTYCLSRAVAEPLQDMNVRVAAHPTEASLIACSLDPNR